MTGKFTAPPAAQKAGKDGPLRMCLKLFGGPENSDTRRESKSSRRVSLSVRRPERAAGLVWEKGCYMKVSTYFATKTAARIYISTGTSLNLPRQVLMTTQLMKPKPMPSEME